MTIRDADAACRICSRVVASMIKTGPRPWTKHALCSGLPAGMWFPRRRKGESSVGHQAKTICAACPVAKQCLTYAVSEREEHGIWGGCGETTRRALGRLYKLRTCDGFGWAWSDIDCRCEWCRGVCDAVARSRVFDANGPNATHGIPQTYNRGCRCEPCCLGKSAGSAAA